MRVILPVHPVVAIFMVLNLFIAIIADAMHDKIHEDEEAAVVRSEQHLCSDIAVLHSELLESRQMLEQQRK